MRRVSGRVQVVVGLACLAMVASACGSGGNGSNSSGSAASASANSSNSSSGSAANSASAPSASAGSASAASTSAGVSAATSGGKPQGQITYAMDEELSGFNFMAAAENFADTQEIMDPIWPRAFIVKPNLQSVLNTEVLTSAKVTKTNPQTVVYNINPKAVWSDGTPISADDFIYAWQSQSGSAKYKDVGGKKFLPANTNGYNQIKSVTSSNNGKTATVVFTKPYADWKGLFNPMLPAHIAKKVGFNNGFANFGPAVEVSGGPFEIKSYTKGQDLIEVPNPKYWGPAPKLSQITYRFILQDQQQPPAVQNGEVQMVNPALASVDFYKSVKSIPGFKVQVIPGLEYQHIDFNESNPYLANADIRHAIAYGTNRAALVQRTAGQIAPNTKALQNRIYVPTESDYKDTSGQYGAYNPAKAKSLLKGAGMTMGSDGYFHPSTGPEKGKDFTLNISTTSGVLVRQQIEEFFQAAMKNIGVKINIQNYTANKLFGTIGPKGQFDIIEFAWVETPFPSSNQSIFCSYTNSECGNNWDHYADPKVDALLAAGGSALTPAESAKDYNQADALLWKDMATLPLFQQPVLDGWSTKYSNVQPNPAVAGLPWNDQDWALTGAQ